MPPSPRRRQHRSGSAHASNAAAEPRRGFTLIELLITVGIVGVLSSVVMVAVSPRGNLLAARDLARKRNARELQNGLNQYLIDHGAYPNDAEISSELETAKPICTQGVTTNTNCVVLDELVSDYLSAIPRDEVEPCPDYSGFQFYKHFPLIEVFATHLGKVPGDSVTELPGCSSGSSSSSSSSTSIASSSSSSSAAASSVASSAVSSSAVSSSAVSSVASSVVSSSAASSTSPFPGLSSDSATFSSSVSSSLISSSTASSVAVSSSLMSSSAASSAGMSIPGGMVGP